MSEAVKIGIIGLGRMGQNHLRVLSLLAAADLYGPLYTRITDNTLEIARPPSPPA